MPELPEVEVIRRHIEPFLVGRVIKSVATAGPSYFFLTSPATLRRRLPGRRIDSVDRRGKYLLVRLHDESVLLWHLGMTGQLFAAGAESRRLLSGARRASPGAVSRFEPDVHTHLRLFFSDDGPAVFFRDVRKLGKCKLLDPGASCPRLDRLGVDALSVTAEHLRRAAQRRCAEVKTLLLDQSVLAGVGNIYADEALHRASIRPTRPAHRLTRREHEKLAAAIREVLQIAIEKGGSSISDYIRPDGRDGGFQTERRVYARAGEPCLSCGATIVRRVIAQRSSCFCPRCQR